MKKIKKYRYLLMPLLVVLLVVQLLGCDNQANQQRKTFVDFLQNTVLRGGEQIPLLSENQRQKFGIYVNDYTVLLNFSQQMHKSIEIGILPLLKQIDEIRVAQDYVLQQQKLQQALAVVDFITQQIQSDKVRTDQAAAALKHSDEVKAVYVQAYEKIVSQPSQRLLSQLAQLNRLTQDIIQVGNFLNAQANQVTYTAQGVQFRQSQQVLQYNALIESLKAKQSVLQGLRENLRANHE